uniref:C2 domain-containing protein n=1 Tax=Oryza punctata TaxID=4537 RepID=A0A0E0KYH8_ORYPU
MARRVLEVTLVSAKDLKKVTMFSKMRVYAVASISGGDPRVPTHRTHADREGGRSPMWHAPLRFPIPAAGADMSAIALHVLLRAERVFGDSDVGEVFVPVKDLVAAAPGDGEHRHLSYHVRRPVSGRKCGVLHISYQITDEVPEPASAAAGTRGASSRHAHGASSTRHISAKGLHLNAITAYPSAGRNSGGGRRGAACSPSLAYHHGSPYGSGAHAQHHHHHHHHYGYGYNPAPYGHGAAAAAAAAAASHGGGGGMGMGAGLGMGVVGGAVAGMVLADMLADGEMDAPLDGAGMAC